MPSAPEVFDRACKIRGIEVFHQVKAHDLSCSDRNLGVACKVTVDLDRKEDRGNDKLGGAVHPVGIVNGIHDNGYAICNDHF